MHLKNETQSGWALNDLTDYFRCLALYDVCYFDIFDEILQCFFPQHAAQEVETPIFFLNAAYDAWQVSTYDESIWCSFVQINWIALLLTLNIIRLSYLLFYPVPD